MFCCLFSAFSALENNWLWVKLYEFSIKPKLRNRLSLYHNTTGRIGGFWGFLFRWSVWSSLMILNRAKEKYVLFPTQPYVGYNFSFLEKKTYFDIIKVLLNYIISCCIFVPQQWQLWESRTVSRLLSSVPPSSMNFFEWISKWWKKNTIFYIQMTWFVTKTGGI